jgi:uncharacterized repeat protein (TIGR01451 family)
MNITNILSKISKLPKQAQRLGAVLGSAIIVAMPLVAIAEFYPARPVFDYNKAPVNGTSCTAADANAYNRCGSMTGPVFNSFINTPSYGDERAFLDGRKSDAGVGSNADQINDVTSGTKEVVLRTYVHNNANQNLNAGGNGVATGAKVRVALPTGTSQVLRARSYISANNAAQVEDTADLVGSQQFSVEYVAGSAKLLRGTAQYGLSDSIVTTGALIGDKTMDGNLPGCFDYAALVEIKVRVNVATYDLNIDKQVRKHVPGQTGNWTNAVNAVPGDKIDYLVNTTNGGTAVLNEVTTRDVLPNHVQLVPGSVKYYVSGTPYQQNDVTVFGGGINGGKYNPSNNTLIVFTVTVLGDFTECAKTVRNVAYAKSSTTPEINDTADVTITRPDCNPVVTHPAVTIDKKVDGVENKQVAVGQNFTYQLVVKNTGDVKLTNVVVTDQAPANVQFVSTDKGTVTGNKLNYTIPELAVGASQTINIVAKVTAYQAGNIVNTACVNAPEVNPGNPNTTDDCDDAVVTVVPPVTPKYSCDLLSVTQVSADTYKFNTQYTAVDGAVFKSVSYNYGDGSTGTDMQHKYSANGNYTVVATVTVTVNGQDKTVTSAACSKPITVNVQTPTPAVTIDKKVDGVENKQVAVGQNFTYQLVVKNTGDVKLTNVVVTDQAPANVQFVSTDKGTVTGNKLNYTIPELAVGASQTINIVAKVTAYQAGNIVNTACVNAPEVNPGNPNTTDDCDDAVVTVVPPVDKCTVPGKGHLPKDDPACKEDKCTVPGKENLPKDDPACKSDKCTYPGMEDKAPNHPDCKPCEYNKAIAATDAKCVKPAPAALPVTGAEGMVGLFTAVTIGGAAAHRLVQSRRYS